MRVPECWGGAPAIRKLRLPLDRRPGADIFITSPVRVTSRTAPRVGARMHAVAVQLHLVQPVDALRGNLHQRGKLKLDPGGRG
jgi:hypothetical protein